MTKRQKKKELKNQNTVVNNNTQQQGATMSNVHDKKQEELNAAFNATKETPSNSAPQSPEQRKGDQAQTQVAEGSKETKEGVVKLVTGLPSLVWNKGLKPAYDFVKGVITRAWGSVVDFYHAEVAAFKEVGAARYLLGRGGKLAVRTFKILASLAVLNFINNLLFNYAGISLFSPTSLMVMAFVAIIGIVASSYLAQKDTGAGFSAKVTGEHIVDALRAA